MQINRKIKLSLFGVVLYLLPLVYSAIHTIEHHHGHSHAAWACKHHAHTSEIKAESDYCPICDYSPVITDIPSQQSNIFSDFSYSPFRQKEYSEVVERQPYSSRLLRAPPVC
ncbi:hypothetical protein [Williamwhitmania taraxaci]|uniref:hypothetical protein n=1 Tax=Williamwhitmania taraxaci TaxID=1640674 RepID=UPI000B89FCEF|nr:hypothetical protein [Williamwhitmania taraxaci]